MHRLMLGRNSILALLLPLTCTAVAEAAPPTYGAHYAGKTSQGQKISFDTSLDGKRVIRPNVDLKTVCFGGGHSYAKSSPHNLARASGRIKRGKFSMSFSESANFSHGVTAKASFTAAGRFATSRRMTGTASVTVRYSNGAVCKSGPVSFTART